MIGKNTVDRMLRITSRGWGVGVKMLPGVIVTKRICVSNIDVCKEAILGLGFA